VIINYTNNIELDFTMSINYKIIIFVLIIFHWWTTVLAQESVEIHSTAKPNSQNVKKLLSENWDWQHIKAPFNDRTVSGILVDPEDDNIWYVSSIENGLYITRDGGTSWEHPLIGKGLDAEGYQIDPNNSNRLLAAVWDIVYISMDKGLTWRGRYSCPEYIRAVLISKIDGSIYLAPQTEKNNNPGVYKSINGGSTFTHLPFGISTNYIICWDIEEDPVTGYLYTCTELADHPQPYDPPLFRSMDGGLTWVDMSDSLYWHGIKIQIDAKNSKIYNLIERGGLYESIDYGESWQLTSYFYGFYLLLDKNNGYLYGGDDPKYIDGGGIHLSIDKGKTFSKIGLDTINVTSIALNNNSSKVFSVGYGSGIWVSDVPEFSSSRDILVINTNDSGEGSFRNAIDLANANIGADTIKFNIPKTDPNFDATKGIWLIQPKTSYQNILDSNTIIDGTSQRIFIEQDTNPEGPEIVIDGSNAETYADGILIQGNGTEIYELTINHFGGDGIKFYNTKNGIVSGCYIGSDYSGMVSAGNQNGITIANSANKINVGPSDFLEKSNVISGNKQNGIFLVGSSKFNIILGNYIGVNKYITDTIPNGSNGIFLYDSSDNNKIFGNSIGGCSTGISISKSNYNNIESNIIGASEPSNYYLYNLTGIRIFNNSKSNEVIENTISFNHGNGIGISGINSTQNRISHNFISNNWGFGIANVDGGNTELSTPIILSIINNQITGTAGANEVIEIFADSTDEGQVYIDSTVSDVSGNFSLTISALPLLPNITSTARDDLGNTSEFSSPFIVTDIKEMGNDIPTEYALFQNYPNPFNPSTIIKYSIPNNSVMLNSFQHLNNETPKQVRGDNANVQLKIYNILGKEIATLINQKQSPGNYEVTFNAKQLPSGVYFYQLKTSNKSITKKMLLLE